MDWGVVDFWRRWAMARLPEGYGFVLWLVAALWIIHVIDLLSRRRLTHLGAGVPRRGGRLHGVVTSHFLHAGFGHLFSNTTGLLGIGFGVAMMAGAAVPVLTLFVILVSGLAEWLVARKGAFVGASGIAFGYLGFVLAYAALDQGMMPLAIGGVVFLVYRSILWGLLPSGNARIGWEGHLTGFVAGAAGALLLARGFDGAALFVGDTVRAIESFIAMLSSAVPRQGSY